MHMACVFIVSSSHAKAHTLRPLGKSPWALVSCARIETAHKGINFESSLSLLVYSPSHQLLISGSLTTG